MYVIKRELSILTKRFDTMKTELERSMERESELLKYKVSFKCDFLESRDVNLSFFNFYGSKIMVEKSQNESKNHKMVNPFALEPS